MTMPAASDNELRVTVRRVPYPREGANWAGSTWCILDTDSGTAKGEIAWRPRDGERLRLTGRWTLYKGQQEFQFSAAVPDIPVAPLDQLRYVCDTTVGLGPAMEAAIYAQWGDDWIAQAAPGVVPRLKGATYQALRDGIAQFEIEREKAEAVAWLMGRGCTPKLAAAAWAEWRLETMGIVRADCYKLADLQHRGFSEIDSTVRQHFDIGDDDPRRMRAGVLYAIGELCKSGSTAVTWDELWPAATDLLGQHRLALITEAVTTMFRDGTLVAFAESGAITTARAYRDEAAIWEFVT